MISERIKYMVAHLFPAYFALVMATGIVSIGVFVTGDFPLTQPLFYLNIFFYVILWVLLSMRIIFYFNYFKLDFSNHARGGGFLTIVAATHILGSQFLIIGNNPAVSRALFYLGFLLWVVFMYAFFTLVAIKKGKPTLDQGLNGIWLLLVVATQSVSVLATQLAFFLPFPVEVTLFMSLSIFLVGCFLYIIIITLIFYRLIFYELRAQEFAPPYWINMGAVAIITLAGSLLLTQKNNSLLIDSIYPFLKGFTLLFWAMGTWWIPIMLIMGAWRHIVQKVPLTYHPQYWGMVFPLGMYTVCTHHLANVMQLGFLNAIPAVFIYAAVFAWFVALFGMGYKSFAFLFRK